MHFPIVLIPLAALGATYAAWKRPAWARFVLLWLMGFAAVGAFVADQLGDHDLDLARGSMDAQTRDLAETHEDLGSATWISTAIAFAGVLLLRNRLFGTPWMWAVAAVWWALFALIAVTAWYGGALVFEQGVNAP